MRLLDAGCGVGLETARLASDHPDMHVTGVDRNRELLEIARRRAPEVEWVEADLTDLDLAPEFDVVRTERVLIHVPDVETVLDNLIGVLAPAGGSRCSSSTTADGPGAGGATRTSPTASPRRSMGRSSSRTPAGGSPGC